MTKAVIFDLDGTLLYTIPDIAAALNAALEVNGFPTRELEAYRHYVGSGIRNAIRRATRPDLPDEQLDAIHKTYQSIYPCHCTERTTLFPDIHEALRALQGRGLRLGVLSNKTEATSQKIVSHYFPDIPFAFVWGNNSVRPLKPDPTGAKEFLALLNIAQEEAVYVGDSDVDINFARNAGIPSIGAVWGFRGREELLSAGATLLAETPEDLPALV